MAGCSQQATLEEKHAINRRHGMPLNKGTPDDPDPAPEDDPKDRYPLSQNNSGPS